MKMIVWCRLILALGIVPLSVLVSDQQYQAMGNFDDEVAEKIDEDDCSEESPPGMVARIGDELIPESQFAGVLGADLADLKGKRIRARLDVIQITVQDRLIAAEATRRELTREELLAAEVHSLVNAPSEFEIEREFHSKPRVYGENLDLVRSDVVASLVQEASSEIARGFIERLSLATPHQISVDLRAEELDLDPLTVVATVGEGEILWREVSERLEDVDYDHSWQEYTMRIGVLNRHLNDRLLEEQARRRKLSLRDLLKQDVYSSFKGISEEDCREFFDMNQTRVVGEYDQIRDQIEEHLTQRRIQILEAAYAEELRQNAGVEIFLREPQPPVHIIDIEGSASIGPADAQVVLVEFIDFQCTRCRELSGFVEKLQQLHSDRVRLVTRHSPLRSIHANAMAAALAAEAARKQGKYREYMTDLFENQDSLDDALLEKLATDLNLDLDQFRVDVASADLNRLVSKDIEEAERLGIDRTPVLFINGRRIEDKSWEGILTSLQREFSRLGEIPR